jgi:integrase/recombinase XerD
MINNQQVNILFQLLRDYLLMYLPKQRCFSENTIKSYRDTWNLLLDYIALTSKIYVWQISFETINRLVIADFLEWLANKRDCSNSSVNQRLAGIRAFYKYAAIQRPITAVHMYDIFKVPYRKLDKNKTVQFLTESALSAIFQQPDTEKKSGIRDLFLMVLMYDTAARISELLELKVCDLDHSSKTPVVYLTGKGGKKRVVPIMSKTVQHYLKYRKLFLNDNDQGQLMFYTVCHGMRMRMSDDNVTRFLKQYAKSARAICNEVPEIVHAHLFRHGRAMSLYKNGMPLALLSEFLGHENPETTLIYAYADTEMKRQAIEKATGSTNPIHAEVGALWINDDEMIKRLYGLK